MNVFHSLLVVVGLVEAILMLYTFYVRRDRSRARVHVRRVSFGTLTESETVTAVGVWRTRLLRCHLCSFAILFGLLLFVVIAEMQRDDLTTAQGAGCLNATVSSPSGLSRTELCDIAANAMRQFETSIAGALLFFEQALSDNVTLSVAPRGSLPSFLVDDCTRGKHDMLNAMESLFSLTDQQTPFESIVSNATSPSEVTIRARAFSLGTTFHINIICSFANRQIASVRMGCCDADSAPDIVDQCR